MKIALVSDTHHGITKANTIRKLFKRLAEEEFDILIHAGDYCGTSDCAKSVKYTTQVMREFITHRPILSVLGNHDYWNDGEKFKLPMGGWGARNPPLSTHNLAQEKIAQSFFDHDIWFLDTDGPWVQDDIVIVGHTGWYKHPNPPTNDKAYLPIGMDGHTNISMLNSATKQLTKNLEMVDYEPYKTVVFVSHFPVIDTGKDYKGGFKDFSWDANIGEMMQEDFNCKHFLNGHAHQYHNGPLRYESGSDYCNPRYIIIEV